MQKRTVDYFPFERLGLRRNPFCALEDGEWSDQAWLHPVLEKSLECSKPIIQILGDPGTGKTSALLALKRELELRGWKVSYIYLQPGRKPNRLSFKRDEVLLLDEIERIPARKRRRLIHSASLMPAGGLRLGFSSHHDQFPELHRPRTERWQTLILPAMTSSQLEALLNDRIKAAARGEKLPVWFTPTASEELLDRYQGDLRSMERALYDVFQILGEKGPLTRARIRQLLGVIGGQTGP